MPFMPFQILGMWLRCLLTLVLLGGAIYLLSQWYNHRETRVTETVEILPDARPREDDKAAPDPEQRPHTVERVRMIPWQFGFNPATAFLLGGLALLIWSLGGGWVLNPRLLRRAGAPETSGEKAATTQTLPRPDGSELWVECYGPADGEAVVLVHGWGLDCQEWHRTREELGNTHRLIAWDLPGLGKSTRPVDRDWSLEKLAADLDAVIALAGGKPVTLIGHSIGAMILLTYCRLFPEALGTRVRGLVLAHGTYTNPVKTTSHSSLHTALQKPLLEPLCHLMICLSPLVRVMNWISYLNGSVHRSTDRSSFSGHETRAQLDFIARYSCQSAPDVVGPGLLAMFRFDERATLARIPIPTLVVTGDKDETCVPEASRLMAQNIPGAKLMSLTGARHCGQFEYHVEFHRAVREFLDALLPKARIR